MRFGRGGPSLSSAFTDLSVNAATSVQCNTSLIVSLFCVTAPTLCWAVTSTSLWVTASLETSSSSCAAKGNYWID